MARRARTSREAEPTGDASPGLTPRLRFPEFRGGSAWMSQKLDQLVSTVPPPKKLQTSEYQSSGTYPIIDQSQELVCGWTDDSNAIIRQPLPLVVFGDHTCAIKLALVPFAQGADGIKILQPKAAITAEFLFYSLSNRPLVMEEYKRHFAVLKDRVVAFPKHQVGEQQKIADCLMSLDDVIAAQGRKVEALKAHKKGLMQHLFPQEGQSLPRLRFPEFSDAPEWTTVPLGELLNGGPVYGVNAAAVPYSVDLPTYLRITDIDDDGRFVATGKASVEVAPTDENSMHDGDIALARTGASVGKSYRYGVEDGPLVFAGFLIRVRPDRSRLVPTFLSSFLFTDMYWEWVRATSARSGQPGINASEYAGLPVPLPPVTSSGVLVEQERIADCLASLDAAIAAASAALDALKTHKKGLMQGLFPTAELLQ